MKILITNDDGIYSEGIYALYLALKKIAEVTVVAPDAERSSVGHGITLRHPLWQKTAVRNGKTFGIALSGFPADCVKFGVGIVLKGKKPDMVVSGINCGPNEGASVHYSGTVAGAREGALMGIPAMAVSLNSFRSNDYRYAAKVAAKLCKAAVKHGMPQGTFLNVNVPALSQSKIKGIRFTRQGIEPILGKFTRREDPNLREYYWLAGDPPVAKADDNTDIYALYKNYVTVTPIHCDLTNAEFLQKMQNWNV
jgi:5'-nucleotidase